MKTLRLFFSILILLFMILVVFYFNFNNTKFQIMEPLSGSNEHLNLEILKEKSKVLKKALSEKQLSNFLSPELSRYYKLLF